MPLHERVRASVSARLTPERTRRATRLERLTVVRLSEPRLIRFHRYLEALGKVTTVFWIGFMASLVLGVDWREVLEFAVNSGRPIRGAVALLVVLPTLLFVAARSLIGFARWRLQRELWRRDVARLDRPADGGRS